MQPSVTFRLVAVRRDGTRIVLRSGLPWCAAGEAFDEARQSREYPVIVIELEVAEQHPPGVYVVTDQPSAAQRLDSAVDQSAAIS